MHQLQGGHDGAGSLPTASAAGAAQGTHGVDEPRGGAVLLHLLGEHGRVLHGVPHQEGGAEARGEGGLRVLHADLGAGDLSVGRRDN